MDASNTLVKYNIRHRVGETSPIHFFKHLKSYAMGKMGRIAAMVQEGRSADLKRLIEASERNSRDQVYFIGKTYSIQDAKQILIFMENEERKIHRNQLPPQ